MSSERDTDSCALCGGTGHTRSNCPWGDKLVKLLTGEQVSTAHPDDWPEIKACAEKLQARRQRRDKREAG